MTQLTTTLITDTKGFDPDDGAGNVFLILKDNAANEYAIHLTPIGLHKTIALAVQAFAEMRKQYPKSSGQIDLAEYTLTGCKYFVDQNDRPCLRFQFDGLFDIAFPVTRAEAELIGRECSQAWALTAQTKTQ